MFLLNYTKNNFNFRNLYLFKQDWFSLFLILLLLLFIFPFTAIFLIPAIYKTQLYNFLCFNFEFNSLSSLFGLMTIFIFYIGILANWNLLIKNVSFKLFANLMLFLIANLLAFSASTLFTFYFFFELTSIPILYFIIEFGKRNRKSKAAQLFLAFTLLGSVCLFASIFLDISSSNPLLVLFLLLLAFFIKLPIFPFYIWLPEAHVESPTVGSIFLAGISLKLGGFGIYRFVLPLIEKSDYAENILLIISILIFFSIFTSSIAAIVVHDLKKIIAYSSISHMGLFAFNLFLANSSFNTGSLIGMIAHSFTAAALFFIAGIIYDKTKSRNTLYLSGLVTFMPVCSGFLLLNTLANISFPGTLAFVSEIIIFTSIGNFSITLLFAYAFLSILIAGFSFKLIKLFYFGNISIYSKFKLKDITRREFIILAYITLPQFFLGFFPNYFLELVSNF